MGILVVWERLGMIVTGWVLSWIIAKIWSHMMGWADELDSDITWVRLCALIGGVMPLLEWWALLAIPVLVWGHWDAQNQAKQEHIRHAKRMAYNQWWSETEYRWERNWERVPKRGR